MNPWLTRADLAELDVVSRVLVHGIHEHRERCGACRESRYGCSSVSAAVQAAVDWAELRALVSKAETLRAAEMPRRRGILNVSRRAA
jgi:hypothetical protein